MMAAVAALGGALLGDTAADCDTLVAEETERWKKVIKSGGVQLEWAVFNLYPHLRREMLLTAVS